MSVTLLRCAAAGMRWAYLAQLGPLIGLGTAFDRLMRPRIQWHLRPVFGCVARDRGRAE